MNPERPSRPSFSPRRRLNCLLHAVAGTVAVLALVVMANYLVNRHPNRWFLSSQNDLRLSEQTLGLLHTITNDVSVTVFYDRKAPFFNTILGLLREYHLANPRLQVSVVDYLRDGGAAQAVSAKYELAGVTNKNLVIFDCEGRLMRLDGDALTQYQYKTEPAPGASRPEFQRRPVAFFGEKAFTFALLSVTSLRAPRAYFLTGHDEHDPKSDHVTHGYRKFALLLGQSYITAAPLSLAGTDAIPDDCDLLIVAGPIKPIPAPELVRIEHYLSQGGRMLALLNSFSLERWCGLEDVLAKWGVEVSTNAVVDAGNAASRAGDLKTSSFSAHAMVAPLQGSAIHLIVPRSVSRRASALQAADAPKVDELVFSSPTAHFAHEAASQQRRLPLVAIVENSVKGVVTERGATRIVVVGDSFLFTNEMIESAGNRDFAALAANWLLDRAQLLHGLGPQPVTEFRLFLTQAQMKTLEWLLLAGIPGAVLLVGSLVWLRRKG